MERDAAETIALQALAFVAADADQLERLLAETGLVAAEIRANAADPVLLGGVLDFVLSNEARLLDFCASAGIDRASRSAPVGSFPAR